MKKTNTKTYRTIFISDVHLGTKDCKAELLNNFLKHNSCETLYLVGDIIDGWKIQKNKFRWKQSHSNVIRRILGHAKHGTRVVYVLGNHDEFLRPYLRFGLAFGNVEIVNQIEHVGVDNKHYLVVHGDLFDGITRMNKWISFLGDSAYDFVLNVNTKFNWFRHKMGFGYWSLSKYLKHRVKRAVDFMFKFEENLAAYCKRKGYDGVICGHIHNAEIKEINGVTYMNDGDWVESCTALVEHHDGRWEVVTWEILQNESKDNSTTNVRSNLKPRQRSRKSSMVKGTEKESQTQEDSCNSIKNI
jgi:UDP-2,3-diacylglucosamine pyrophosphatase LpxH